MNAVKASSLLLHAASNSIVDAAKNRFFFIVIKIKQLKVKRAIKITAKQIGDVERVNS